MEETNDTKNNDFKPLPGGVIFDALRDKNSIIMAVNARVATKAVTRGIFRAAKESDSAVMFELAKTECNQHVGYTGHTPKTYSKTLMEAAKEIGFDVWALHADHITVKKGTDEEIQDTKELLDMQIDSGYTSFAIDASYLFNMEGTNVSEELAKNIEITTELANYIKEKLGDFNFGLEVEVGEVGKVDADGVVLTTPEEAVTFIKALNSAGFKPHAIATSNGTTHGNVYDDEGNLVEQISIDIPQTKSIAKALRENGMNTRIAQHGITGTPRALIESDFPKGDIIKGNVATFWMNLVWDVLKEHEPELYKDIWNWTLETYTEEANKKKKVSENEVFGKYSKYAGKEFCDRINAVSDDTNGGIEALSYAEALVFFKSFGSYGSASIVRESMKELALKEE